MKECNEFICYFNDNRNSFSDPDVIDANMKSVEEAGVDVNDIDNINIIYSMYNRMLYHCEMNTRLNPADLRTMVRACPYQRKLHKLRQNLTNMKSEQIDAEAAFVELYRKSTKKLIYIY